MVYMYNENLHLSEITIGAIAIYCVYCAIQHIVAHLLAFLIMFIKFIISYITPKEKTKNITPCQNPKKEHLLL